MGDNAEEPPHIDEAPVQYALIASPRRRRPIVRRALIAGLAVFGALAILLISPTGAIALLEDGLTAAVDGAQRGGKSLVDSTGLRDEPTPPPVQRVTRITDTDGEGVAVRSECDEAARTELTIPEGTRVSVVRVGTEECLNWSLVEYGDLQSWVEDRYVSVVELD